MSIVKIKKSFLSGEINIPPSKSVAHRAILCSFLAGGGKVSPIINSNDMKAMEQVIGAIQNEDKILDCIESGNTSKFIIPVAAALGREVTIIGSGRLPERPIEEYLKILPKHGVRCISKGGLPLSIEGKLTSGKYEVAGNISSQYISGLLLALPILEGDSEIILTTELQSKPYVDMTIKVMSDFGVDIIETQKGYFIKGNQTYQKRDYVIEGDWSQAAFFLAAGAINGDIVLKGLDTYSTQGDKEIVNILKRFGANIEIIEDRIQVKKSELNGIDINVSDIPDTVPALAVTAAFANGTTTITGAERLRYKESDRIKSVVSNLKKFVVDVIERQDGMIIKGGKKIQSANLEGYNDHRILMAFSVMASCAEGETTITDAQSIKKTYPNFFEDYNFLGGKANVICNMW